MHGSLAISGNVVYVARQARSPEIRSYDLDGARLEAGFTLAGLGEKRASADGIAADLDHRLWIADATSQRVRSFTVFGAELLGIDGDEVGDIEAPGAIGRPVAVAVDGVEDETRVLVGSSGERRHALRVFGRDGRLITSLRSRGERERSFQSIVHVALRGRFTYACERDANHVQVFRDDEFHGLFVLPAPRGSLHPARVTAVQPLSDRRMIVTTGGEEGSAVHLLDPNGRILATLAQPGVDGGQVFEPSDIALVEGDSDRHTRIFVIDQDGDRVQVFTLEGVCYGSFADLPRATT